MSHLKEAQKKWNKFLHFLEEKRILQKADKTFKVTWNSFLILIVLLLFGACFAVGAGAGYFASLVQKEPVRSYSSMKHQIFNYEETSRMYFAKNQLIGKLRADLDRQEVSLKNISPNVTKAVISTEDRNFYEHDGIVPKAIFRAVFQEVSASDSRSGGSTLTQQLIKNQILTNEVSFDRKAKEILLALRLEKVLSKKEILNAYLNIVPFGRNSSGMNVAGIQAAAQGVFGVDAKNLTLPQAAFLAGMPQNPFVYTPFTNKGEVKKDLSPGVNRMKTVLNRMRTQKVISEKQYKDAITYNVRKNLTTKKKSSYEKYPYLSMEIERRAVDLLARKGAEKDGKNFDKLDKKLKRDYEENATKQMRQQGLNIHTTINKDVYEEMNAAAKKDYLFGSPHYVSKENNKGKKVSVLERQDTGAMLIENRTGAIVGFVGGRNYDRSKTNHATQMIRQNGSTMKPLLDYAPAMEQGKVQPGSILEDKPLQLGGWQVHNFDDRYHGLMTARTALAKSYNTPAVRTYLNSNQAESFHALEKMGFTSLTDEDRTAKAAAIGGIHYGVSVEENTNAYATFANGGNFVDAYLIDKIETQDGKVLYQHKVKPVHVFSPQTSFLMLDMMRDVLKPGGTASPVAGKLAFSADWAGKTGSTQEYRDSWFVATNPNVTLGVWHGYDKPDSIPTGERQISLSLWAAFANAAYKAAPSLVAPSSHFNMPDGIVRRAVCGSVKVSGELCLVKGQLRTDLFNTRFAQDHVKLDTGEYIIANGQRYKAGQGTPKEFIKKGVIIGGELYGNGAGGATMPYSSSPLADNGRAPGGVIASYSAGKVSWSKSADADVIGYRIYQASSPKGPLKKVGSVTSDQASFPASTGIYYVTAVDVSGHESKPSPPVTSGKPTKQQPPKKKKTH
ncbi:penicillin-binding protein [Fictibacillus macauensis ZFHKF-1]|uniref:Penicillin-binding protein n=1 Tax=Fictibacillus macauensis ZFHKF-1 TaxID=1196324 RepID=I8AJ30_9BACL|nr:transglycosylase domain-containing protein [Fictibacillus macauensis]EIT85479.1 penicillin-binding protein [Fictibacillus macauensis ZFHKF-1]